MWWDVFATDPGALNSGGGYSDKLIEYVKHVQRGLATLGPTPLIYPALAVDLWTYRNFGEIYYVEALVGIAPERLMAWHGAFRVDGEALCFPRSVLHSDFPYRCRAGFHIGTFTYVRSAELFLCMACLFRTT